MLTMEKLREHISAVVGYNWPSEYADALENGPEGHVIEHLIALSEFIGEPIHPGHRAALYGSAPEPEHSWVTCAPGDPTAAQWHKLYDLAGSDHATMTHYDEKNDHTRGVVYRADSAEETYIIAPDGVSTREEQAHA